MIIIYIFNSNSLNLLRQCSNWATSIAKLTLLRSAAVKCPTSDVFGEPAVQQMHWLGDNVMDDIKPLCIKERTSAKNALHLIKFAINH